MSKAKSIAVYNCDPEDLITDDMLCGGCGQYPCECVECGLMPNEIVAWPADVTPPGETALTGTWSARRHYTDEAGKYVSCARFEQVEAAAQLGLEMAKANDLWNTAEEIAQALESAKQN